MANNFIPDFQFSTYYKTYKQKGRLVYEYNPFHNLRLDQDKWYYDNQYYTADYFKYNKEDGTWQQKTSINESGYQVFEPTADPPIFYKAGELVDFITKDLNFDLEHPVDLLPQYSYDNSVNLIINDQKNKPRLINSRFSPLNSYTYQVVDRKGTNDTNIYNEGSQFELNVSLYKQTVRIPKLRFINVEYGGNLRVGNYHFYFKYADADGNETDYVAESGLVSIFKGKSPQSVNTGYADENSHKLVKFELKNIDNSYQYINVYYTRSSADIFQDSTISAFKIQSKIAIESNNKCNITITGFEEKTQIPLSDINLLYEICDTAKTQTTTTNRLFFGNIQQPEVLYQDLADISLRFIPELYIEEYDLQIDQNYKISSNSKGYYDPKYIYDKVGYWDENFYRFGIVYIMPNNTLTPVFNVRGGYQLNEKSLNKFQQISLYNGNNRNYINYSENDYLIYNTNPINEPEDNNLVYNTKSKNESKDNHTGPNKVSSAPLPNTDSESILYENALGVVYFDANAQDKQQILGVNFHIDDDTAVIDYLKNTLKVKGFFFVRQKRIPTTLCQAYMIGVDKQSHTPVIPVQGSNNNFGGYITESFVSQKEDTKRQLIQSFEDRKVSLQNNQVKTQAAICPDYDVDYPYYNSLFCVTDIPIIKSKTNYNNNYLIADEYHPGHYYGGALKSEKDKTYIDTKILGVEDNVKLVAIDKNLFSARAGEAEENYRFEFIGKENKTNECTNVLRGSYGPYLAITGMEESGCLVDIKIPGYNEANTFDYIKIRYADKSPYYAISDRIAMEDLDDWFETVEINKDSTKTKSFYRLINPLFRGDCYICQFTHRVNRNFQDPSFPTGDIVIDKKCWDKNFKYTDGVLKKEDLDKINLADLNAIQLGIWVTFTIRSTYNLNVRSLNDSIPDEQGMFGHPRGFYPYYPILKSGSYKIPEALCYNKAFEKSLSERWNMELIDAPAFKNDFSNRIVYSDISVTDSFQNGFRTFSNGQYRDYPKTYGEITKILEYNKNILCIYEHGIDILAIDERVATGQGDGGNVYIKANTVLPETPNNVSDTYGSQWKDSIIKTPRGVYGVDTIAKKIWRINNNGLQIISDFKIGNFLNENITLGEHEKTPILGIRNIKAHFNKNKNDVIFTYYDNLEGIEEKVWSICFNEVEDKWVTFYSWVPSFSENIYNQFFTFDRNTSKYIAKLYNTPKNGLKLSNHIITKNENEAVFESKLSFEYEGMSGYDIKYELLNDPYGNKDKFTIKDGILKINNNQKYSDFIQELYETNEEGERIKDENGRYIWKKDSIEKDLVTYIYIKVTGSSTFNNQDNLNINNNGYTVTFSKEYTIALISEYNIEYLSNYFWKHGSAGIIDIQEKAKPTFWYNKQHPFEFEIIVCNNPNAHKIFDNLEILSNNAEPESFHYEIVGDCYEFAKDKKNIYIRQEATRNLYQELGEQISYNDYKDLQENHRFIHGTKEYDMSTIFPQYYTRKKTFNLVEDSYQSATNPAHTNYTHLSGSEIVKYNNTNEYRIWTHAKAVDMKDPDKGRLWGNMQYKEDKWYVQINPINLIQCNEDKWPTDNNGIEKVPIEISKSLVSEDDPIKVHIDDLNKALNNIQRSTTNWEEIRENQYKLKDKYIKIRIRYSGEKTAIIYGLKTLYSISMS